MTGVIHVALLHFTDLSSSHQIKGCLGVIFKGIFVNLNTNPDIIRGRLHVSPSDQTLLAVTFHLPHANPSFITTISLCSSPPSTALIRKINNLFIAVVFGQFMQQFSLHLWLQQMLICLHNANSYCLFPNEVENV